MVLVGLPEAGKTTLVRHFTGKLTEQEPERTVGVDITPDWRPLEGGSLQVNIWDFAGQEDYYSSHQLFLTKGSLFILVVDLNAFAKEVSHGPDNFTDPNGRVYWWLEMLHMRVPGAAVVLVGSHVDELADNGNEADQASRDLLSVANNFIKHKEKTISTIQSDLKMAVTNEPDPENEFSPAGGSHPRGGRTRALAKHLVVHQRVFKASLDPQSILKLREWILKAAMGEDCPVEFDFPSVNKSVPKPWIDAFSAMETLEKETPYVLWSKAVEVFRGICTPEILPEADDLLFRAMKHREAEGGVLLSRSGFLAPKDDDMLHLDPTWLVQLVRRLADHNLVEDQEQGTIRLELHAYSEEKHLDFQPLWKTHCDYCKSGQLDKAYLRYLWTYRKIDPPGRTVDVGDVEIESIVTMMTDVEIESIVTMMTRLLVMYKSRSSGHKLLVPARLPQHGDLQVLAPDLMKGIVVKTQCSFMQVYPPPGIVGRFLAWSIDQIAEVRQCWQHGAFFMYKFQTGLFEVVMYESVDDIHHRDGMLQKKFSALTFGVRGSSERARTALDELTESVENLVRDPAHGYPGLGASICFKGVTEDSGRDIISEIRALGEIVRTLESVVKMLLKQKLLAAREDSSEYPRLVILEPENTKMSVKSGAPDKQRFTWMKAAWEKVRFSDALHHTFRLRFCCEHDLSEVPCGPDGRGYLLKKNKEWVKSFFPLMQASLWIVRVAVGIVSNVDLPLNDVLGAVVAATGAELLEGLGTEVPASFRSIEKGIFPEFGSKSAQSEKQKFAKLKGEAYKVFCDLMREIESTPSLANSDWLPLRSSRPESVVSWRDEMVKVDNGSGGLAWVLKKNKDAYLQRLK